MLLPSRTYSFPSGGSFVRGRMVAGDAPLPGVTVAARQVVPGTPPDKWPGLPFDTVSDTDGEYVRPLPLPRDAFEPAPVGGDGRLARVCLRHSLGSIEREFLCLLVTPGMTLLLPDFDWDAAP
jgi:hypothetical protein